MPGTVSELRTLLRERASSGRTGTLGGACRLTHETAELRGASVTRFDKFRHNTDAVVLSPVRCGERDGLLGVVCQGNYKDEGCAVASGAAAAAFLEAFDSPLLSEADVVPTLRRSMIAAESSICAIADNDPLGFPAETNVGPRRKLSGIGTCVTALLALPEVLFVAQLGDSSAFLRRESSTKRLTVEHTLGHDPRFRKKVENDPTLEAHKGVVLRVLGLGHDPVVDVTRLALLPGDQIIAGNLALPLILAEFEDIPDDAGDAIDVLGSFADEEHRWSPATFVVISGPAPTPPLAVPIFR